MRLARKVEVQPTPTQRQALLQHAGNARWAYNWGLRRKQEAWAARKTALAAGVSKEAAPKVPTAIDLHRELNALKRQPVETGGVPWMYEASKCAPQEALRNLDRGFENFFQRVKAGKKPGYPRFKKRSRGIGGFKLTGAVVVHESGIALPRIGRLRIKPGDRETLVLGEYVQASVTEQAGRWFVSVAAFEIPEAKPNGGPGVGIDLGVVRLATLSDGGVIENPRALKASEKRLKRRQKEVSRRRKGSARRLKAKQALSRAWRRVRNVRQDALHKATTMLTKSHGRIVIEDLKVRNMTRRARGHGRAAKAGLNRVVLDAGFGEFRRMLEYKGKLYGCEVVAVPAAYTSQRCSSCQYVDAGNRRSQSAFECLRCGLVIHADLNAAINIYVAGSDPETKNARGAGVRPDNLRVVQQSVMNLESACA